MRVLAFVLHRVVGYRKAVVRQNLRTAFPDASDARLKSTEAGFYRYFATLITGYLRLFFHQVKPLPVRARFENCDQIERHLRNGQDVVLLAAHTGNWEHLRELPEILRANVITAYTPVKPARLDALVLKARGRYGMSLVPRGKWYRYCLRSSRDIPKVFLAIADQRPSQHGNEQVDFFGRKTDFHKGAFRLAAQRGAALMYVEAEYDESGFCTFRFLPLPERNPEQAYYTQLERTIRRAPACWLWSHRRWKFNDSSGNIRQNRVVTG